MTERKTISEAELRKLAEEGKKNSEIAAMLGWSRTVVSNAFSILGIAGSRNARKHLSSVEVDAECERAQGLIARGLNIRDAARELGVNFKTLRANLVNRNLPTTSAEYLRRQHAEKQ